MIKRKKELPFDRKGPFALAERAKHSARCIFVEDFQGVVIKYDKLAEAFALFAPWIYSQWLSSDLPAARDLASVLCLHGEDRVRDGFERHDSSIVAALNTGRGFHS